MSGKESIHLIDMKPVKIRRCER